MERSSDEFFAGTAFARDQDRRAGIRNRLHHFQHIQDLRMGSEEAGGVLTAPVLDRLDLLGHGCPEGATCAGANQGIIQLSARERLLQKIACPVP